MYEGLIPIHIANMDDTYQYFCWIDTGLIPILEPVVLNLFTLALKCFNFQYLTSVGILKLQNMKPEELQMSKFSLIIFFS